MKTSKMIKYGAILIALGVAGYWGWNKFKQNQYAKNAAVHENMGAIDTVSEPTPGKWDFFVGSSNLGYGR